MNARLLQTHGLEQIRSSVTVKLKATYATTEGELINATSAPNMIQEYSCIVSK